MKLLTHTVVPETQPAVKFTSPYGNARLDKLHRLRCVINLKLLELYLDGCLPTLVRAKLESCDVDPNSSCSKTHTLALTDY